MKNEVAGAAQDDKPRCPGCDSGDKETRNCPNGKAACVHPWHEAGAATHVKPLTEEAVEWVVNDNAELGVKIGNQFFFLYKGRSLVYEDGKHDDGTPMRWRHVFKREFGECCHPVNYEDLRKCGHTHMIGTVSPTDDDEWQDLPPRDEV